MGLFVNDTSIAGDDGAAAATTSPTPQTGWYPQQPSILPDLFLPPKKTDLTMERDA